MRCSICAGFCSARRNQGENSRQQGGRWREWHWTTPREGRGAHAAVERRALELALEGPGDGVEVAAAALKMAIQLHAGRVHLCHGQIQLKKFKIRSCQNAT